MQIPNLYINSSELEGRGVFCGEDIMEGSVIEICPLIVIPEEEMTALKSTQLYNYYFEWGIEDKAGAIALGYGSLYNHSSLPNAYYEVDEIFKTLTVYALKEIAEHTEITFNYSGQADDDSKVWFEK